MSFFFALKARLQVLKFEFCQVKLGRIRINLQLTGKISLKHLNLILEYDLKQTY